MHIAKSSCLPALSLILASFTFAQQHTSDANVPVVAGLPPAARASASSIDPEKIRAHVRFLSLDLLEGRGPGTRGAELAAEYIATQFALDGLEPAGDKGTYFQQVPLVAVHTIEDKTKFAFVPASSAPVELTYGSQIVSKDETGQSSADFDAPIVFVGYGIYAPEYNWDDYAGVDVKGKIALVIVNEPPSDDEKFFKGKTMTYYGRWTYKYEEASRRGAVGVLIIHRTDLASYGWQVVQNSQAIEKSYLAGDPLNTLRAAAWIQHDVAQRLLTLAGLGDLDQAIEAAGKRGFHAQELNVRLKAHIESRVRKYNSTNVVARVPGVAAGPANAVLYTAHYDHLGIDPDAKGDGIYNGAADNGTGCGILLELARAYARSSQRPPHAMYFSAVTAEEQGLLGSQYLGEHTPVPARDITLDLNYDMLLPIGVPLSASLGGAERINFWPTIQTVAKDFDLKLLPDPDPSAGHYYRSDHFSLARAGIPAFSIDQGRLFEGHDEAWGRSQFADFVAHHYHQPSDEYQAGWDFRGDAKMAQFGFVLGWLASEQAKPVEWQSGDEFESARKASEKGRE
ncbi:M28 family peptidase [Telmatobacter sp. DSM 110680]|uniref:M28 family peptidase n=1 Tax=Telmatobacter sp. DSM 110680 TaxID=3036704 RepID=A0AAU7DNR6_9BACT